MVGIHYSLRQIAPVIRNEWAYYADGSNRPPVSLDTPEAERLWQTLYDDAIWRTPQPPTVSLRWANPWFDSTQ